MMRTKIKACFPSLSEAEAYSLATTIAEPLLDKLCERVHELEVAFEEQLLFTIEEKRTP
jgi:hypothetical protein